MSSIHMSSFPDSPLARPTILLPAAGAGSRMGVATPKQYLKIHQQYLIDITLSRLLAVLPASSVWVGVSAEDTCWADTASAKDARITCYTGGKTRADTVWQGLVALEQQLGADDWVLVHDAARPCFRAEDIRQLCLQLQAHPVGGLLGVPVGDTLKRVSASGQVLETLDRRGLWRALTPQMFRFGVLLRAMQDARQREHFTDEAAAVESLGLSPHMVQGASDNIKVTLPADLALAADLLSRMS